MNSSDRFRAGVAALQRGDFAGARFHGEALVQAHPGHAGALQFLGVVNCQAGDLAQGVGYLRRAIAAGGDTTDNRLNLAKALAELGRYDEALEFCTGPQTAGRADFDRLRAEIAKLKGDQWGAVAQYQQYVIDHPTDADGWNNLGNARHATGDFDGALDALRQAQALSPESSTVQTNIARVFTSLDRFEDACLALEQAALLAPGSPTPLLELGRALIGIDHSEAALRALGDAARLDPRDPKIFMAIGLAFTDLGRLDEAERAYRAAIQLDPCHGPAYLDLGAQLEKSNRLDELRDLVDTARGAGLAGGEIDYLRALLLSREGRTEDALALARTVQTGALHRSTIAQFVGQLADRLDRTEEAFAAFEEMNAAAAASPLGVGIDRGAYQRDLERLTAALLRGSDTVRNAPSHSLSGRTAPAFLVGFPRSGTTLLDTFLMGHADTHVLEEVPVLETVAHTLGDPARMSELDDAAIANARAQYFAELDRRAPPPPGKLVIDKNPLSMIRLPLIHRLFPDARIILALRHPCDAVLSCFMQNFKVTEAMAGFLDIQNAARTYDRVFAYWEAARARIPAAAVVEIRYEDLVADQTAAMRPVIDFLGLVWDDGLLDHQRTARDRGHIRTPSYAQVTEPVYARACGRWARYRDHLRDALPVLTPWCERFGYSLD